MGKNRGTLIQDLISFDICSRIPYLHHVRQHVGAERSCFIRNTHKVKDPSDVSVTDGTGVSAIRVRLPKKWNGEQFGRAEKMLGAYHVQVLCVDGTTRMGRIKGKIKKRAWIREGDFLIVAPWSFQDTKCDISYRYLPPQVAWLRRNQYIL